MFPYADKRYPVFLWETVASREIDRLPLHVIEALEQAGYCFYRWPHFGADVIRLVTNWTTSAEIERFVVAARHARAPSE